MTEQALSDFEDSAPTMSKCRSGSTGVKTATEIPTNVISGPYPGELDFGRFLTDTRSTSHAVEVRYVDGQIEIEGEKSIRWMLYVQAARDRHEQNLELLKDARGFLFLRTVRSLRREERLLVWYGDELAREVGIPVLTPANIQGDQKYVCTRCLKHYQYPNTLKAHIRFRCRKRKDTTLGPSSMPDLYREMFSSTLNPIRRVGLAKCIKREMSETDTKRSLGTSSPTGPKDLSIGASFSSAFRPHRRGSPALSVEQLSPRNSPAKSTSPGHSPQPLSLTVDTSDLRRSPPEVPVLPTTRSSIIPSAAQPIQIFNHIHAPPLALPLDHAALKYYYPFYPGFGAAARYCCPLPPTACGGRCLDSLEHPFMYPYINGLSKNIPSASNQKTTERPVTSSLPCVDEPRVPNHANPFKFPLPSEKAGEPLDLIPRSLYLSKSRKGHLCIYCGKLYSRKYGLKIHLRTHTGYKPLKCKVCLRPFGDPSNLNKHIRLHAEGDTPYRCEHCGKVLVRRRDLERHIKSRHPEEAAKLAAKEPSTPEPVEEEDKVDLDLEDDSDVERDIDIEED